MARMRLLGLQWLFGWMNLALAVPAIYLMFGMPVVMRQHDWSGTEIGLFQLAALPAIFKFLFAVPVQRMRLGRGHFVHWLLLLCVALLALYWQLGRANLIDDHALLFALTLAVSVAATWADIPLNALAVQWLPRAEQMRAGSIRSAAMFLGAIVGGGILIVVQARHGWQAPFWLMGAGLALGMPPFLLLCSRAAPRGAMAADQAPEPGMLADWAGFFGQPGARQWTLLLLTSFPFIGAAWLYLKPLMLDLGMPLERVAFIVGIVGGSTGALFSLIGGLLIPLLGIARAIVLYLLVTLGALVLLTLTVWMPLGEEGWLIASAILVAAGMGLVSALMFGLTMCFTRRQRNATDYGLQVTLFTVARLAVPVLAGMLLDVLGYDGMLAVLTLGVLAAFGIAFRVREAVARSTQPMLVERDGPACP
ncbi:AmpG protein [Castellaniella defragrans 65Phen]|uniref:AmpG protein n=2 Tax=Castellaniella defragrans TaxID=75697 RepID=W8X4B5_CASD6|nr:MFS transporter [Castellaniella defragrans]KAB0622391.1 MFS transporter [Castellaniella defragrans]MBB6083583.1 putative MFS family arabinose efflux permease [Castellaniella defragrans]CDM24291.1 AmpG protein [Castellaniella defragrans 65Phen]